MEHILIKIGFILFPGEPIDDMEAPVNLQYRDSQHQSSMLQALNTMRKNDRFCDVILHVSVSN